MACQKGLSTFCGLVVVNTNAHLNGACFDPSCRAGGVAASDLDLDAWADALEADPTWYGNTPQQPKPPKIDPKTVIAALPEGTLAAVKEAIIQAEAPTEYSAGGHRESSFEILRSSTDGSTGFGTFVPGQWQAADGTPYRYARELDKTPNGQFDQMLLDLHVHGSAFTRAAGYVMGPSPADPLDPRDGDIPNANGIYNIVVSMADRRVYFYSQNPSQTTSITLQAFLNGLK
jgi:hypothetical protein